MLPARETGDEISRFLASGQAFRGAKGRAKAHELSKELELMKTKILSATFAATLTPFLFAGGHERPGSVPRSAPVPLERVQVRVEIPYQDLRTYASIAEDVVRVRILDIANQNDSAFTLPTTIYRAQVVEALKGAARDTIEIRVAGGQSSWSFVEVDHAPQFSVGQEAILFLCAAPPESWYGILGLDYGSYGIELGAHGDEVVSGLHAQGESPTDFMKRARDAWHAGRAR